MATKNRVLKPPKSKTAKNYRHPESESPLRPEVGTQAQFKKKKPPVTYRYDSSLAPELNWDGQNPGREIGEWLLNCAEESGRLPAPHKFPEVREFKDAQGKILATVDGLADAIEQL